MIKATAKDCRQCGACCVAPYDQDVLADLDESDLKRLNRRWIARNVGTWSLFDHALAGIDGRRLPYAAIKTAWKEQRCGPLKGAEVCACVALRGSVLHRTSCSIYKNRPESCRKAVKPGDRSCLSLRERLVKAAAD